MENAAAITHWGIFVQYLLITENQKLIRENSGMYMTDSVLRTKLHPERIKCMKYNQTTLDKIEKIIEESGYVLRYERGTFQSGYCILEEKKVVVLNKFLITEDRISILMDLIPQLEILPTTLTTESKKLYEELMTTYENKE